MKLVLLVEDNDNDAELTRLGFLRAKLGVELRRVDNGEECMAFLRKEGRYADAPTPDLILLDLNMPRMDGTEVMRELAKDARFAQIVTVVLTSSRADEDILRSYELRARSYLVKPNSFDDFAAMIQAFGDHWFSIVTLPPAS